MTLHGPRADRDAGDIKAATGGQSSVPVTATVIPFPERPLPQPCGDPVACGHIVELPGSDGRTLVCLRCGLAGHDDARLTALDAALASEDPAHV